MCASSATRGSLRVSDFELEDRGNGRFSLRGEMSFDTADRILRTSEPLFRGQSTVQLDLSEVSKADSAGLALLLEWKSRAMAENGEIEFVSVPESLLAIAKTTEVRELI